MVERGEADAVGLVGDQQVEDGPDEGEAAVLAGEPAHDLGAAFDLAERPLEQVGRPPSSAVPDWVSQVHDERVEVVGEAAGGCDEPALVEVVDERLEAALGVLFADRVIERLPVGVLDALALAVGQLGLQIPSSVNTAALAV